MPPKQANMSNFEVKHRAQIEFDITYSQFVYRADQKGAGSDRQVK